MDILRAARLDSKAFPMGAPERSLLENSGNLEIVEIAGYDEDEIAAADPHVLLVVSGYVPRKTIERLNRCVAIIRYGIGYEKIDLAAATEKGIVVCNTVGYCTFEVAEHAMALLLACARRLPDMQRSMKEGSWPELQKRLRLSRIHGKTLGLIGLGAIGRKIAERANGFGMKVTAFDDYAPAVAFAEVRAESVGFDELLSRSDFICLACPLNETTRGMIGRKQLEKMKPAAILVNTARGGLIDEKALAEALEEGRIACAGIDVYDHFNVFAPPGDPPEGYYHGLDNVLLTPHMAYVSDESERELHETAAGQLKLILSGVWPAMCVNPEVKKKVGSRYRDS